MTTKFIILIWLLIRAIQTRSQPHDTARFRLDKEKITNDIEAAQKGELKRSELNLIDWKIEGRKTIKLKKFNASKLCKYNYKNFTFFFEYEQFLNSLYSSYSYYVALKDFRTMIFKGDTIDVNKFVSKPGDENFLIEYLIKLISEKNLCIYDMQNKLVEKVFLKKATWETRTDKGEVTLFYVNNIYLFYRNDNICTSKRFFD